MKELSNPYTPLLTSPSQNGTAGAPYGLCPRKLLQLVVSSAASSPPACFPFSKLARQADSTLLSQGRSPYDEVVEGEGIADPRDANQLYDDKGRPYNPETKRLNREIVRSHNEVMHVIGVAEPDPSSNEAEVLAARRYMMYEQDVGDRMGRLGDILTEVGVWGVWGLRRRVLVREGEAASYVSSADAAVLD